MVMDVHFLQSALVWGRISLSVYIPEHFCAESSNICEVVYIFINVVDTIVFTTVQRSLLYADYESRSWR